VANDVSAKELVRSFRQSRGAGSRRGFDAWSSRSSTRLSGGDLSSLEQDTDVVALSVRMGRLVLVASCVFRALGFGMAFFFGFGVGEMLDRANRESTCLFFGHIVNCLLPSDVSLPAECLNVLESDGKAPGWLSSDLIQAGFWHNFPDDVTYIGISDTLRRQRTKNRSNRRAMGRRFRN
jgi:hypothetical protein